MNHTLKKQFVGPFAFIKFSAPLLSLKHFQKRREDCVEQVESYNLAIERFPYTFNFFLIIHPLLISHQKKFHFNV